MDRDSLICGVDGGGTKTVAWLARKEDPALVLGRGQSETGNPQAAGIAVATNNIQHAVRLAFEDAGVTPRKLEHICLCLAGVGRNRERTAVLDWAVGSELAERVTVDTDAVAILAAMFAPGREQDGSMNRSEKTRCMDDLCGVALIGGTGSFAWGRDGDGKTARAGGFGYLLGDEGGGYSIASHALNAGCRAADGTGPKTPLLERILAELDLADLDELLSWRYAESTTRAEVAKLARLVFDFSGQDAVSKKIVDQAVSELAKLVLAVAAKMKFASRRYSLALGGGLLQKQPPYAQAVLLKLQDSQCPPEDYAIIEYPVAGALWLASQDRSMPTRDVDS